MNPNPDSQVWTLLLDCEVSCTAAYISIKGSGVPISWGWAKQVWAAYIPPLSSILALVCFAWQIIY